MELRQYFSVLRKWLWLIVVAAVVAGGASYYATAQLPNQYQASAKIMVGQSYQSLNPTTGQLATSSALAQTYVQLVKTSLVLQGVIDELGLNLSIAALRNMVNASQIEGTQIIEIRVTDTNRTRVANIANAVAHQLSLLGPATSDTELAKRREFVQSQIDDLEKKIQDADKQIQDLENSIKVTTSVRDAADKRAQVEQLRTQQATWQQQYTQYVNYITPQTPNTLSVLEQADVPDAPFAPNMALNVGLALVVGIILAVAVAFLIEYLDDTLKSKEDISRVLAISTLGEIGSLRGSKGDKLVTANEPRSANAEAYRILRTNISFSSVDKPLRSILLTSASPSEGKSITAANLAITMAQAGYRTVLVDCDLRKPSQQKIFGVSNDTGLTNCLLSHTNLNNFMRPTRVENLRLLPSGPIPPNPAELLGSRSMTELLAALQTESDILIVDSPPVLAVADASILTRVLDGVLLVVDSGQTRRDAALRAKESLSQAGARILGIVLNRVAPGNMYYAYNNKYYTSQNEPSKGRSKTPASETTS
jgi:succinoglycan biosynthesis transport protein ExoP